MIRVASLFSGIGGFEKGIHQADQTTEIVFTSEIDKYARQIYKKNFGVEPYGDITQINAADVPEHDILVGGFPCQDVSIAGKREGLCGARSGMFFEIVRILREKQPRVVFLENVRGLLSSNRGWDFARILIELENVGYTCEWQVFNSKNHGVPPNRERVFIIGHLGRSGGRQIFPITEDDRQVDDLRGLNANTITARYAGAQAVGTYIIESKLDVQRVPDINTPIECVPVLTPERVNKRQSGRRFKEVGDPSFTVTAQDRHGVPVAKRAPLKFLGRNQKSCDVGDYSFTIDSCNTGGVEIDGNIRRLTPTECERLQGFPDGWTANGVDDAGNEVVISDAQRYKCLGNAVTVNVIEFIYRHISRSLEDE